MTDSSSSGGQENVLGVALKWIGTVQKVNDTAGHFIDLLRRIGLVLDNARGLYEVADPIMALI